MSNICYVALVHAHTIHPQKKSLAGGKYLLGKVRETEASQRDERQAADCQSQKAQQTHMQRAEVTEPEGQCDGAVM